MARIKPNQSNPEPTSAALPWIVRLRWGFLAAEAAAVACMIPWIWNKSAADNGIQLLTLSLPLIVSLLSNFWFTRSERIQQSFSNLRMFTALLIDLFTLSWLLTLTAGSSNPFTILYLLPIVVGLVALPHRWTSALAVAAVCGYGSLFVLPEIISSNPHLEHSQHHVEMHLYGMFFAFVVASGFICTFVSSLAAVLKQRDSQLQQLKQAALQQQKISALATLAAGAAHELATPLQTIALVTKELKRSLGHHPEIAASLTEDLIEDLELIDEETTRCREIIDNLRQSDQGDSTTQQLISTTKLLQAITTTLPLAYKSRKLILESESEVIFGRFETLVRIISNLVINAFDASDHSQSVTLQLTNSSNGLTIAVVDSGRGMSEAELSRATEPFYTTKAPGNGIGLGLFIVQSTVAACGGTFTIESGGAKQKLNGTTATVYLPFEHLSQLEQTMISPQKTSSPPESSSATAIPSLRVSPWPLRRQPVRE